MGCDFHQFFTKRDLDAGNLVFIDALDRPIDHSKVHEVVRCCALKVSPDYVLTCSIDATVDLLCDWLLDRESDGYIESDYIAMVNDEFNDLKFISNEDWLHKFGIASVTGCFPESCKEELNAIWQKLIDHTKLLPEVLHDEVKRLAGIVKSKCRSIVCQTDFMQQTFYDINLRTWQTSVQIADGKDALLIAATTC